MKTAPSLGQYVVLNTTMEATLYMVVNTCGVLVDLADADSSSGRVVYTCDRSLVEPASEERLGC